MVLAAQGLNRISTFLAAQGLRTSILSTIILLELYNIQFNPLAAGPDYIIFFIFYKHIKYQLLKMLKINR